MQFYLVLLVTQSSYFMTISNRAIKIGVQIKYEQINKTAKTEMYKNCTLYILKEHFISYGPTMKMCLLLFLVIYGVEGYTITNQLHKDTCIFKNYDKVFRPGDNRAIPTEISIYFYMKSLKELIKSDGKIGIVGSLGLEWEDI